MSHVAISLSAHFCTREAVRSYAYVEDGRPSSCLPLCGWVCFNGMLLIATGNNGTDNEAARPPTCQSRLS